MFSALFPLRLCDSAVQIALPIVTGSAILYNVFDTRRLQQGVWHAACTGLGRGFLH